MISIAAHHITRTVVLFFNHLRDSIISHCEPIVKGFAKKFITFQTARSFFVQNFNRAVHLAYLAFCGSCLLAHSFVFSNDTVKFFIIGFQKAVNESGRHNESSAFFAKTNGYCLTLAICHRSDAE